MTQPNVTSGAVAKPNSSAPKRAATNYIAAGFITVHPFHGDPAAQVVQHQGLVRLGQPQFPGKAGVFDAGLR
jgi:hypothetical protein